MKNLFSEIIKLELVKELLSEGRVETAKEKYPDYINTIDYFVLNDPSGNNKYLDWLIKIFVNDDDAVFKGEMVDFIKIFHKNISKFTKKDINQYKTWSEFYDAVKPIEEEIQKREADKKAEQGAKKIYESTDWLFVRPMTYEASCKYGAGTKWCTTSKENPDYYLRYTKKDLLAYLIHKSTNTKFAFHYDIGTKELSIFNPPDENVADQGVSGHKINSIKKFLDLLMKGQMENLSKVTRTDIGSQDLWGIIFGSDEDQKDSGSNIEFLEESIDDLIVNRLSESNYFTFDSLQTVSVFLEFLDLLGIDYDQNDDESITLYGSSIADLEIYLSQKLNSRNHWRDRDDFMHGLIKPASLKNKVRAFKEMYGDYAEVYVSPKTKKIFRELVGSGLALNLDDYFKEHRVEGGPSITPEEAKKVISVFNKELKTVKTEFKTKRDAILKDIKPSKRLLEKMENCIRVNNYNYDNLRVCIRYDRVGDEFVTYQGKRKKLVNFIHNVLEESDTTEFVIEYMKFRDFNL